jgi:hypothetical protein
VEKYEMPENDLFQIFEQVEPGSFSYHKTYPAGKEHRSADFMMIVINCLSLEPAKKRADADIALWLLPRGRNTAYVSGKVTYRFWQFLRRIARDPLASAQGLSNKNPATPLISEKMSDWIRKSHFKLS